MAKCMAFINFASMTVLQNETSFHLLSQAAIQIFHCSWDMHGSDGTKCPSKCVYVCTFHDL